MAKNTSIANRVAVFIGKNLIEIIWGIFLIFVIIGISPPFLAVMGHKESALKIHSVYRIFCHQRVERSPFLFGTMGVVKFYSVEELQYFGAIPEVNPYAPEGWQYELFNYPYIGDEVVGYKTAICIRDLSIFISIVVAGFIYLLICRRKRKIFKFDWKLALLLTIPMVVDGVFQLLAEIFGWQWVPQQYFANNWKRLITGALFGVGFVMLIFPRVKENAVILYNSKESKNKLD